MRIRSVFRGGPASLRAVVCFGDGAISPAGRRDVLADVGCALARNVARERATYRIEPSGAEGPALLLGDMVRCVPF